MINAACVQSGLVATLRRHVDEPPDFYSAPQRDSHAPDRDTEIVERLEGNVARRNPPRYLELPHE